MYYQQWLTYYLNLQPVNLDDPSMGMVYYRSVLLLLTWLCMLSWNSDWNKIWNGVFRDDLWGHSQYVQNKVSKRKITRKAGGEEVVEEVEEPEEEEE